LNVATGHEVTQDETDRSKGLKHIAQEDASEHKLHPDKQFAQLATEDIRTWYFPLGQLDTHVVPEL